MRIEDISANHFCGFKALDTHTHLYITYNVKLSGCDYRHTGPDRWGVSLRGYALLHANKDIISNSLYTCIIFVDLGKAFKRFSMFNRYIPIVTRVAKPIEDILRYHKTSFDTLNTLVTRTNFLLLTIFILSVLQDQTSVESL